MEVLLAGGLGDQRLFELADVWLVLSLLTEDGLRFLLYRGRLLCGG